MPIINITQWQQCLPCCHVTWEHFAFFISPDGREAACPPTNTSTTAILARVRERVFVCAQSTGCKWTGITISKAQLEEATRRVAAAGLADRVQLLFCDYRECGGAFDAVVSCEMVEAVGQEHLQGYFQAVGRLLKPGGRAVIQVGGPGVLQAQVCGSAWLCVSWACAGKAGAQAGLL